MDTVTDFLGRPIKAGNTIVYPARSGMKDRRKGGSQMWLEQLTVTQVVGGLEPYISGYKTGGRRVTVKNIKNCVVVEPLTSA